MFYCWNIWSIWTSIGVAYLHSIGRAGVCFTFMDSFHLLVEEVVPEHLSWWLDNWSLLRPADKVQRFLLAAIRSVLHPHLDKEPAHCLPPGQGEAWEGICTAGSPHETNPPPASGKAGRWGGGRGRKEWRQPCPAWRSPPVTEIFEIQQRCLSGCCSSCEAENILWSLFDSPIAAVGTLVFSFFEAALRQFSSVSFSIGEAVSETGGDGFF